MAHSLIVGKNNYHSQKIIKFSFQMQAPREWSAKLYINHMKVIKHFNQHKKRISVLNFKLDIYFILFDFSKSELENKLRPFL